MTSPTGTAAGYLDESTAQTWVEEVQPLAEVLVTSAAGGNPPIVRVQARQAHLEDAPHGALMITWPHRTESDAVINHLADCRPFLRLYELLLRDLPDEGRRFLIVLRDGTRLRLAITNDVLQILAAGPGGVYSMIRHHALMFLAAHVWLPPDDQPLWEELYHASVRGAADRYRRSKQFGHPRSYLDKLEHRAFAALDRLAAGQIPIGHDASGPENADIRLVLDYMHAANAAVAILLDAWKSVAPTRRTEWMIQQLAVDYREDDFLVEAWGTMADA